MALNLKFEKYEGVNLESFGTLASIAGAKGSLAFAPKSLLAGNTKRMVVVITKKDGESSTISCAQRVSEATRAALANGMKKADALGIISKLEVIQADDDAVPYITFPAGQSTLESFTVEALAKVTLKSFEEAIAL